MGLTTVRAPDGADAPAATSTSHHGRLGGGVAPRLPDHRRHGGGAATLAQTIANALRGYFRTEFHASPVDRASPACHRLSERGASLQAPLSVLAGRSGETSPVLAGPPAPGADSVPSMTGPVCRTETDS
jgi:hypothetical protein